jgi:hypothetical protein
MHKLPIGIQDFPKIRENDFHYVDKTAVIHHLLNAGTTFFLSRPRRFGKSLLCSTLGARFCDICGIRQDELERDFAEEVAHYAREKKITGQEYLDNLRKWYNGYHFSESPIAVYNPFGLLNHFATGKMEPYWFSTGTPTFLLKLIENQDIDIRNLEKLELTAEDFGDYRKDKMLAIPVLYQAGYLTISRYLPDSGTYMLDYPNDEVRISFAKALADKYAYAPEFERTSLVLKFSRSLKLGNFEGFMEALVPFFAGIPYDLNDQTERHYQVIFYLVFRLLRQYCDTEVKSTLGRADAIVTARDYVYCFEFNLSGTAEEALAQIDNKGYLTPYTGSGKRLVKVGVEFDREKRNVGRWLIGEV